jgi:tripartite-type tricarboxylate transporter receptor subunit TctC
MPKPWTHYNVPLAAALIAGFVTAASAQGYPNRPITLVVPFPPGGSTTIVARIVADKMSEALGQSIVVDNRGGAGGTVATRAVAKTSPDGYTILLGYTGTLAIGPTLYGNAGYEPRTDFAPIGRIGTAPNTLVVHPSLPVHSVAELIAYAKDNPGKLNYGSAGIGTVSHVCGEYFATAAGVKITHIPYKSIRGLYAPSYACMGVGLTPCNPWQTLHWTSYAFMAIYAHVRDSSGT